MKLSKPKAYGEIKPLHRHDGRPLWDRRIVVPELEDRPNCTECPTKACWTGRCDGGQKGQEDG